NGLRPLLGQRQFPAESMHVRTHDHGKCSAEEMRLLLGEGERLITPPQGLVWIAKYPQRLGRMGESTHAVVQPVEEGMGAVLLGIVEDHTLLQVRACRNKLSQQEQG